jgi:hypothetical protein
MSAEEGQRAGWQPALDTPRRGSVLGLPIAETDGPGMPRPYAVSS